MIAEFLKYGRDYEVVQLTMASGLCVLTQPAHPMRQVGHRGQPWELQAYIQGPRPFQNAVVKLALRHLARLAPSVSCALVCLAWLDAAALCDAFGEQSSFWRASAQGQEAAASVEQQQAGRRAWQEAAFQLARSQTGAPNFCEWASPTHAKWPCRERSQTLCAREDSPAETRHMQLA